MSYIGNVKVDSTTHLVGSTLYGTCDTAAGTAAKVVTCANFDKLLTGVTIHVKFTYSNTAASPTLNVNSTGAKTIYRYGTTKPTGEAKSSWNAGAVVSFTYDGTSWFMNDWLNNDTTYNVVSDMNNGLAPILDGGSYVQPHFLKSTGSAVSWDVPPVATTSYSGYMSATDKTFLDSLKQHDDRIVVIDVAAFSSLPATVYSNYITEDHYVLEATLGTPAAQESDWTITTSDGSFTIAGSMVTDSSTSLHVVFGKVDDSSDQLLVINFNSGEAFNSLPQSVSNARISTDHYVVQSTLSNPAAQTGDWTVSTSDGLVGVSGTISGETTLQVILALPGNA